MFSLLILISTSAWARPQPEIELQSAQNLFSLVESKKITSIEKLLETLPSELLANYSLIHDTRSNQAASPLAPRVTLFAPSGNLYITFNGGHLKGAQKIEIIHFNQKNKNFEFNGLDFSGARPRPFNERETKACLKCHSSDRSLLTAHPIWDTYPDWPDRYGHSHIRGTGKAPDSNFMRDSFESFKILAKNHSRYKHLLGLQDIQDHELAKMNSHLGNLMMTKNLEKLAATLVRHPDFTKYKQALLWIQAYAESEFLDKLPLGEIDDYQAYKTANLNSIEKRIDAYHQSKLQRFKRLFKIDEELSVFQSFEVPIGESHYFLNFEKSYADVHTRLDYVMMRLKLPLNPLSLTLERGTYSSAQGQVSVLHLNRAIKEAISCEKILK